MDRHKVLTTARLAGCVRRYHTWPTHHVQTIGEHTWNVMRIWWQIFGSMPPLVSEYLLWHDAGELVTGDAPFPIKARNPEFKKWHDRLEQDALLRMGGKATPLSEDDRRRCKACDLIDMLEFGLFELNLGNKYAYPIIDDVSKAIRDLGPWSTEDALRISTYLIDKVDWEGSDRTWK